MKYYLRKEKYFSPCNILRIMKITLFLLIGAFMQVSANGFAQKITLKETNSSLEKVLKKISAQSNYDFLYNSAMLKDSKSVSIDIKDASIEEALTKSFDNQPLDFTISENTVIVKRKAISEMKLAQDEVVYRGTVVDEAGQPLPGVSVVLRGTTRGTTTNNQGVYSISVPATRGTLVFSFLGFAPQEFNLGTQTQINVTLLERSETISDIVVTALGIERQKRELGYAVSDISSADIAGFGEPNPIASIAGKVAGVNISTTTAGPTGSSRVVIRGIRELQGSNQPLYVIDGVPAVNGNIGSANQWGGFDLGDGMSDVNPNDIESISVLKGASAAVLYGSRALNGVILITTKSGRGSKGLGIEFNSSLTTDEISTKLDEVQKIYGQGNNGLVQRTANEASNVTSSWGPKYTEIESIIQRDGQLRPYKYIENNVQDFFRTGLTAMNTLSLTGGNDKQNLRFSYSNVANKDIIPGSGYDRNNFSLRAESEIAKGLTIEVIGSLMGEKVRNRPALTDDVNNIGNGLIGLAGNFDQSWLSEYENADGTYINYTGNQYRANPYWTLNKTTNDSDKLRTGGSVNLNYQLNENWSARVMGGTDFYTFKFHNFYDKFTPTKDGGQLALNDLRVKEDNFQGLINFDKEINSSFKISAMAGGNIMKFNREQTITQGSEIVVPGKELITNFKELRVIPHNPRKEIQSLFGNVGFGYNNYLFLNLQGRNDWSSTLPKGNHSFFYPAADLSVILSDALDFQSSFLNYAKIRTSYGQVGSDTDPYKTRFLYSLTGVSMNGFPMGEVLGSTIPNSELKPQQKTSFEIGTDLSFFNDRISLDFTYYNEITNNVLLDLPIPQTTGYSYASLNAAKLKNTGVEILLKTTPVRLDNGFRWDLSFNFSKNYNTILDIYEGLEAYTVAEARWAGATIVAEKGKPFGTILGNTFVLDANGKRVHGSDGLPLFTDAPVEIGNSLPKWTGGAINNISYKGFDFKATFDVRVGGDLFSMTSLALHSSGSHPNTVAGRDSWNEYSRERRAAEDAGTNPDDIAQNGRGYIGEGVNAAGEVNNVAVNPSTYWGRITSNIPHPFVYDASYMKLRDVGVSYTLPQSVTRNMPFASASIGVIGRNLWIIHKNVANIDPESNYNNGNGQGFEYGSLPGRRSIGFNLHVKF